MKTEEQIRSKVDYILKLLERKRNTKQWDDYEYYQIELDLLYWVLEDE